MKSHGLLLAGALACGATGLSTLDMFQSYGIGALTLAIVLGMAVGNSIYPWMETTAGDGVAFAKTALLRLGIILYGLRLTFQDVAQVGVAGVVIDTVMIISTFGIACLAGTRLFGLDRGTAMLIGAGSSICGAAAVMAAGPVVGGRPGQITVAVSSVVLFGTLAMFLYPALYALNVSWHVIPVTPAAYGRFVGSTIHEVAQVVVAGRAVDTAAANTAVVTKMLRVMMLAPCLLGLSGFLSRGAERPRIEVPWFAFGFLLVTGINSLHWLAPTVTAAATRADTLILSMAMAALGLTTRLRALRAAGPKPLALGAILFGWLLFGGAAVNAAVTAFL